MNLDELKLTWQAYDEKIRTTQQLGEKLVLTLIKDKSKGTLSKLARELRWVMLLFTGLILFLVAAIVGNAFDFTGWLSYLPMGMYLLLSTYALIILLKEYRNIQSVNLTKENLRECLQLLIRSHEHYFVAMGKIWQLCMIAGVLFGISLILRKVDDYGITKTLLFIGVQVITVLLIYAVAKWGFNISHDPHTAALKENLRELEELSQG
ncbi:MAG: hypothetical protein V4714_19510 [Bacteroidota bacterium]